MLVSTRLCKTCICAVEISVFWVNGSLVIKQGAVFQQYMFLYILGRENITFGVHLGGILLLVTQEIGLRCLLLAKLSLATKCRSSGDLE